MSPTVSVALCTYNGARFIEQQVASILNQRLLPTEVILADDGSSDGTVDMVRRMFEGPDGTKVQLRVLPHTERLGVTRNFERAMRAADGDLIALCDQDDIWHVDRLSSAVNPFTENPDLLFQHGDADLIGPTGESLKMTLFQALRVTASEKQMIASHDAFSVYLRRNLATGATVLFRQDLLLTALPIPSPWVHDEWLAAIAAAIGVVDFIERPLIDYRQHSSNAIGVQKPTLRYQLGRMLEPRDERYMRLASRADGLVNRLSELDAPSAILEAATAKANFEHIRADLPRARILRLPKILRSARAGLYNRLSSQGNVDVVRDLLQPAGARSR